MILEEFIEWARHDMHKKGCCPPHTGMALGEFRDFAVEYLPKGGRDQDAWSRIFMVFLQERIVGGCVLPTLKDAERRAAEVNANWELN